MTMEDVDLLDAVESMDVRRQSNGHWLVQDNLDPFPWTIRKTLRGAIADILVQRAARTCRTREPVRAR
jgi:hypothetical protein